VGAEAQFRSPRGVAVDDAGNVFVADTGNNTLRKITPAGVVTTLGGMADTSARIEHQDGIGSEARFNFPCAVAVDKYGAIYVADTWNNCIRKCVPVTGPQPSRLANLSTRGVVPVNGSLTVGFTLRGGSRPLLVRAVGPTLERFGVAPVLSEPHLRIVATRLAAVAGTSDAWGGDPELAGAAARAGAFALPADSNDAAILATYPRDGYTAQITSRVPGGAGIALAEIYDLDANNPLDRLENISTLGRVGAGGSLLTTGFVIAGGEPKRLLIRAVGPALASFGVPEPLADPRFDVRSAGGRVFASNDNWDGSTELATAFAQVGAFPLPRGSNDAAAVVSLPPGAYTVTVVGGDPRAGTALVEVYDLDP
jgi:hypothetical protein